MVVSLLRRASVRARLVACFVGCAVALVVVAVVCVTGFGAVRESSRLSQITAGLAAQAQAGTYLAADWNGWQTAYALDANLDPASLDAAAGSRAQFVAASGRLDAALTRLSDATGLTDAERRQAGAARQAYTEFMTLDERILAAYRTGTPAGAGQANGLVLKDEIAVYQRLAAALTELSQSLGARSAADAAHVGSEARDRGTQAWVLTAVVVGLLALVVPLLVASVTLPLRRLEERLRDIADGDGDLTRRLDAAGSDEVARAARAFNTFADQMTDVVATVSRSAVAVSAAAGDMESTAGEIADAATQTFTRAGSVSAAAGQVNSNTVAAASGSEEMSASIREIARSAGEATAITRQAVETARRAGATVARLGESSAQIGVVVEAITGIAAQTNLLALNATIEAARAGDAGKGFAVVAGEVKDLSQETARATEDIGARTTSIQDDVLAAVQAIGEIGAVIEQIDHYQSTIAAAVEEQTAVTAAIAHSVAEAAGGSGAIAREVADVVAAANGTRESIGTIRETVAGLARSSAELRDRVARYDTGTG